MGVSEKIVAEQSNLKPYWVRLAALCHAARKGGTMEADST
jgi:hypothetical protein